MSTSKLNGPSWDDILKELHKIELEGKWPVLASGAINLLQSIEVARHSLPPETIPFEVLRRHMNHLKAGIMMLKVSRYNGKVLKVPKEDLTSIERLMSSDQIPPENLWLMTILYDFFKAGESICKDFTEACEEIKVLTRDIKKANEAIVELLELNYTQGITLRVATSHLNKKEGPPSGNAMSQLADQDVLPEAHHSAEYEALLRTHKNLLYDVSAARSAVRTLQRRINDTTSGSDITLLVIEAILHEDETPHPNSILTKEEIEVIDEKKKALKHKCIAKLRGTETVSNIVAKYHGDIFFAFGEDLPDDARVTTRLVAQNTTGVSSTSQPDSGSKDLPGYREIDHLVMESPYVDTHHIFSSAHVEQLRRQLTESKKQCLALINPIKENARTIQMINTAVTYQSHFCLPDNDIVESMCKALPKIAIMIKGSTSGRGLWLVLEATIVQMSESVKINDEFRALVKKDMANTKVARGLAKERETLLTNTLHLLEKCKDDLRHANRRSHDESSSAAAKKTVILDRQLAEKSKELEHANYYSHKVEAKLNKQVATLEETLTSARKEIGNLERNLARAHESAEAQMMRHAEEETTLQEKMAEIKANSDVLKLDHDAVVQRSSVLEQKNKKLSDAVQVHIGEYKKLKGTRDFLRLERDGFKEKCTALENENVQLKTALVRTSTAENATQDILNMKQKLIDYEKLLVKREEELQSFKDSEKTSQDQVIKLVSDLHITQGNLNKCTHQQSDMRVDNARLQARLSEAEQNQKTTLDQLEHERTKSKRVQDKLGVMMAAFVAAGLELP